MSKLQDKYERTYEYLKAIADSTPDGYFYINVDKTWRDLDSSRRAIYRHLEKLNGRIFKVFNGTFVPDKLAIDIFKDSGRYLKSIASLYYIPRGTVDSQQKRDAAVLQYCFQWKNLKHFLWWAGAEQEYDECPCGLSEKTKELLEQYFKYMVHNRFDFDDPKNGTVFFESKSESPCEYQCLL